MKISSLYKDYYQKSKVFLYPCLYIKRGASMSLQETYLVWDNMYSLSDYKLISVYDLTPDTKFKTFESIKLLGNKLFDTFFELENGQGAYVFDFSEHKDDYDKIVEGRYSQLSNSHKVCVKNFFSNNKNHLTYIQSYLHPDRFYDMYAELLSVPVEDLKRVGELCSKPDLEKETLLIPKKDLCLGQDLVISQK
jgi:hypothetical protein